PVAQPVGVDQPKVGIGEDRKVEIGVAAELRVRLDRIDDDTGDRGASLPELVDPQLQTLQLRDAEGSPMATIEDEQQRLAREVAEPDDLARLIRECEVGGRRTDGRAVYVGNEELDVDEVREGAGRSDVQEEQEARYQPP